MFDIDFIELVRAEVSGLVVSEFLLLLLVVLVLVVLIGLLLPVVSALEVVKTIF